jgi:hypothetical protein
MNSLYGELLNCRKENMTRDKVFQMINEYQNEKWGTDFDDKNTPNDWVAYITRYLGKAVLFPFNGDVFRGAMLKVAALAVAVLEREDYAPRHYDR